MAYSHHHQNHHTTTATQCFCHQPPPHHYPLPPSSPPQPLHPTDPYLIASLTAHLLQTPLHPHSTPPPPHYSSPSLLSSLLHRIDTLESLLLHHLPPSSSMRHISSLYLRNAAARVIQTHFRRFLVRRSTTLGLLKQLALIKSEVLSLKSLFNGDRLGFVDFDYLSRQAINLLLHLDSILGEDQMIRDSKKSITRDIMQLLELVDGVCVKRHQVLTRKMKNMRLVRNDNASTRGGTHGGGRQFAERGGVSKNRKVDSDEKKLITSLRERVERIGRMSRALEEEVGEDEVEGFEHFGGKEGHIVDQIAGNYGLNNGVNPNAPRFNGKKRVSFVEDRNMNRVYIIDGDKRSTLRDMEEIDDVAKGGLDEEEANSDAEKSSQSSENTGNHRSDQVDGNQNHDEFSFSAPEPPKMDSRSDFSTREPGFKIVG